MNRLDKFKNILILILMFICFLVLIGQFLGYNVWSLICGYWLVLFTKNLFDFLPNVTLKAGAKSAVTIDGDTAYTIVRLLELYCRNEKVIIKTVRDKNDTIHLIMDLEEESDI